MGTIKIVLTPEQLANLLTHSRFACVDSVTRGMDDLDRNVFCLEILNFNWDESVTNEVTAVENTVSRETGGPLYMLKYPKEYYDKKNAGKLNDYPSARI